MLALKELCNYNKTLLFYNQFELFYFSDDTDHLIFSNRSFTYVALGQFEEALVDADVAIKLKPHWPKVSICNACKKFCTFVDEKTARMTKMDSRFIIVLII